MSKDVIVNITRETTAVTAAGFGFPLIVSTEATVAYAEYTDKDAVKEAFTAAPNTVKLVEAIYAQTPVLFKVAIVGLDAALTADALKAVTELHNDFYFLLSDTRDAAIQGVLSDYAEEAGKMYFTAVASEDALTVEGERTVVMVHDKPETYPEAAWIGNCSTQNPGAITWKFKNLKGIAAAAFTNAEIDAIHAKNFNTYVQKLGFLQTSAGKTASGEYIDNVRAEDHLRSRLEQEVSKLFATNGKVPYTDAGIALVANVVRTVLRQEADNGIIATDADGKPMFAVVVPKRSDIDQFDVASRTLNNVNWTATLAGAVEQVTINGVLTY